MSGGDNALRWNDFLVITAWFGLDILQLSQYNELNKIQNNQNSLSNLQSSMLRLQLILQQLVEVE